jgi:hypothetical protein
VGDVVDRVRTPTPPPPDYELFEVRREIFEQKNKKDQLWYTDPVYTWFLDLHRETCLLLGIEAYDWNFCCESIKENIEEVKLEFERECMERRFTEYSNLAKKRPIERTPLYSSVRKMWADMANDFGESFNGLRREMEIPEIMFKDPDAPPPVEEPVDPKGGKAPAKKEAEKKVVLKKFKNPEEETAYMEEFKNKMTRKLCDQVIDKFIFDDEQRAYNEFSEYPDRRFVYNIDYFDK